MPEPRRQLHLRRLQPSESRELRGWIIARHYTGVAPPGYRLALEVLHQGERIGGLLSRPNRKAPDGKISRKVRRVRTP